MAEASRTLLRAVRFMVDLPGFLRRTDIDARRRAAHADLDRRGANFADLLARVVAARPHGPYARLLAHAGLSATEVGEFVARDGLQPTLDRLYEAGVFVRLDEFKGRRPIERGSLSFAVRSHDFDNPLVDPHVQAQTGGTRSAGGRIRFNLTHYARSAVYDHLLLEAFERLEAPFGVWRPVPPWAAGIQSVLSLASVGIVAERWFSQRPIGRRAQGGVQASLMAYAILAGRAVGRRLPWPEHVPLDEARTVAAWLAGHADRGRPASLNTNASSAVRVCLAAEEHGLDIAGSFFRVGGEPFTSGKLAIIERVGASAATGYSMTEIGRIGLPCAARVAPDEVHLIEDKLALLARPVERPGFDGLSRILLTTLVPTTPQVMINVESDDAAIVTRRDCGCSLADFGYRLQLHTIRSTEKLTSEGIAFLGTDLVRLLEDVLPARFGGGATDWQLVEEEEAGLPKVTLLVHPRLGALDERSVLDAVDGFLAAVPGGRNAHDRWRSAGTLRFRRAPPIATGASKIQPLHVSQPH